MKKGMKLLRVKVDREALADLRRSGEIKEILDEHAYRALRSLGSDYKKGEVTFQGVGGRAVVRVSAATREGKKENLESNTIIKAVLATREG